MNQPKILQFRSLEEAQDELLNLQNAWPKVDTLDQWQLPLILDHCAESLEFTMTGFPEMKPGWFRSTVGPIAKHVFLLQGKMSHNTLDPIPGDADMPHSQTEQEAFERLLRAIGNFKTWNRELAEHFAYGVVSRDEAEKLQAFHIADHLSKIVYPAN